jgi:hypothetical protein
MISVKKQIINIIHNPPEDSSYDEILRELAFHKMIEEEFGNIKEQEIFEAIMNGEVIENYDSAKPYPSELIYGERNEMCYLQ